MQIKVGGVALNQTPFDWKGNRERILDAIQQAKKEEVAVLCLPELCITGYGCEDAFFNPHVQLTALENLLLIAPETRGMAVCVGLPVNHRGVLFNTTALLADGKIVGFLPKKFLAGDGVHYEPRWFKPWPSGTAAEISVNGVNYPFGDLHFDFNGIKIGFEICEEAWVAERPGAALAKRGVDIILNPSASHFAFGKFETRKGFVSEGSRAFNVAYVYSNLLGNEAGRIIFDGGVLIADGGKVISQGPRFTYRDVELTIGIADLGRNRVQRERTASYQPEFKDNELCIPVNFKLPLTGLAKSQTAIAGWEQSANVKEEEFTRAVSLGLFDFLRKSRQHGFVVSLSGGIDSAVVTLLCRMSLDLACKDLSLAGMKLKLRHISAIQTAISVEAVARHLITTAYQGTENSSRQTQDAAAAIAEAAGATHHVWSVDSILKQYRLLAEEAVGEKLTWEKYDSTLQNIQARTRGPAIWMLANIKSALLLATSNRSEAAVGYATMDGDTCGGISPIAGIDKNFLRQWSLWVNEHGPMTIGPVPAFSKVLSQPPSAELRPQSQHQTDEDDLMPYDVLDAIERMAIRDKCSPAEIFERTQTQFPQYTPAKQRAWVAKFFRLWCRNQWKRERYAPAFHLDDESLDPKTWCRFPILSSGFEEELQELESRELKQ